MNEYLISEIDKQLLEAVYNCDPERMRTALMGGANPNVFSPNGRSYIEKDCTPIMAASKMRDTQCLELLIKYGADINYVAKNSLKHSAITEAAYVDHYEAIDVLLQHNVVVDTPCSYGKSALSILCWRYSQANRDTGLLTIKRLIDKGANINYIDPEGNTPLLLAADGVRQDIRLIQLLLSCHPDLTIINNKNYTLFDYVESHGRQDILDLIHAHQEQRNLLNSLFLDSSSNDTSVFFDTQNQQLGI